MFSLRNQYNYLMLMLLSFMICAGQGGQIWQRQPFLATYVYPCDSLLKLPPIDVKNLRQYEQRYKKNLESIYNLTCHTGNYSENDYLKVLFEYCFEMKNQSEYGVFQDFMEKYNPEDHYGLRPDLMTNQTLLKVPDAENVVGLVLTDFWDRQLKMINDHKLNDPVIKNALFSKLRAMTDGVNLVLIGDKSDVLKQFCLAGAFLDQHLKTNPKLNYFGVRTTVLNAVTTHVFLQMGNLKALVAEMYSVYTTLENYIISISDFDTKLQNLADNHQKMASFKYLYDDLRNRCRMPELIQLLQTLARGLNVDNLYNSIYHQFNKVEAISHELFNYVNNDVQECIRRHQNPGNFDPEYYFTDRILQFIRDLNARMPNKFHELQREILGFRPLGGQQSLLQRGDSQGFYTSGRDFRPDPAGRQFQGRQSTSTHQSTSRYAIKKLPDGNYGISSQ